MVEGDNVLVHAMRNPARDENAERERLEFEGEKGKLGEGAVSRGSRNGVCRSRFPFPMLRTAVEAW